ncbi:AEC family transporter [Marinobacterium weihaiense]|uniref:AEC family transporter n=1 Tax=Marinobacterium weihaiense TaxID=2851016 RepID=A0ABS6MB56_9GAMM|nr:AEC family transporter [Marinobacterium weihaiense]MBV0933405.1 AEC family transporter [Marinobacterium weihaiense]
MDSTLALLERIFLTVFPLVAIVGTGFFYARARHTDMSIANRINIDVFCPALIFSVMSAKSFDLPAYSSLAIGALIVVLGSGLLIWPLCRLLGVQLKTFLPPMMFNNSGNLGIPLLVLAFGEQALPAAVVLFLVENLLHFTVGIYMLDHRTNPFNVLRMPMIIATIAGLMFSTLDWTLPDAVQVPIDMLGQIAIPLMLFALGVRMTSVDFSNWKIGLWGTLLAPLSGILVALSLQPLLQLEPLQFSYLLIFGALPPAVLNYMMAERYQQEPQQVASIVLLGNIGSLVVIPLVLVFALRAG